ncbi:conjugal transfer protein TraN [Rheinheimera sp.]|uniref:conjugal transfer protein TraN n=1 Tax=Rheinheimera sp. TaxID=1869214 RepID=UPI0040471440
MRPNKIISGLLMFTMLCNLNIMTFTYAIAGASFLYSSYVVAEADPADTPKLEELKSRYGLDNPTRNHQTDSLSPKVEALITSPGASRDMIPIITGTLSSTEPSRTMELEGYFDPSDPETFDKQRDLAINLSTTHGTPTGTVVNDASGDSIQSVDLEYARSGTRRFVRDADGKLVMQVIEGVDRVSNANANDLFSNEHDAGHPGYSFETGKQTLYGDGEAIFTEGRSTHETFKDPATGRTSAGRGYRAVTDGAYRAVQTPSPLGMLEQSFTNLETTQDPTLWLSSCTTETIPSSSTFTSTSSTEHFCQDTGQANFDHCEVERVIKPIIAITESEGIAIESCGDGCFDIYMGNKNDNEYTGDCLLVTKTAKFKLSSEYPLSSVTLSEAYVDDHAIVSVNDVTAWSFINGQPGATGSLSSASSCELRTSWRPKHNGAMQSALQNAQLSEDGEVNIRFDTLIGGKGEGFLKFRLRFSDPTGNYFKGNYIQYPEGCYDALTIQSKTTDPLAGIYDSQMFTDEYDVYQCTSPIVLPICDSDDFVIGDGNSQSCYTEALQESYCENGIYNSVQDTCEISPTYYCPLRSDTPCGEGQFSVAEESELVDGVCNYTDIEHCGGWQDTIPASLTCPNGYELQGNMCAQPSVKQFSCASGEIPKITTLDGVEIYGCEAQATGYTDRTWTCPDSLTYDNKYCDIQLGTETDSAYCAKPKPNTNFFLPKSFCTFDQYQSIDEGTREYPPAFLADILPFYSGDDGNKTWRVNLQGYRCDPTQGRIMCFPDPDTGEEQCYDWEDLKNLPDRCARYTEDSSCTEIERECTEGWLEPISGRCMAYTVTYRCDEELVIDYETEIERNTCESMIPCVGGNCEVGGLEQNDKFVEAMVAGSVIDNIQGDSSCEDPNDPTTCRIFEGEYKYCSWETSGLGTNCCEEAKGVDILGYVTFTRQMLKVNQMAYSGAFGEGISGGYQKLAQPITNGYRAIADWAQPHIRSATESIFGNAASSSGSFSALTDGISAALQAVQQQVYQFVYDMLPDTLANMVFDTTVTAAGSELVMNEAIGNLLSNVMAVYAAYQMIKLALTLLTACDEYEMDMGVKLAQRQCFKVGPRYCNKSYFGMACMQRRQDYCCYSSILARIVMKEAYDQLSINPLPFGTKLSAESDEASASCLGLSPEQLSMLDFNAPSMQTAMQEWIGLLLEAGEIPTETTEQSLTGGATSVDASCPPQQKPVLSCHVDPVTLDEICEHARDPLGNLLYEEVPTECIKELTPGQIWNAADRKPATERITGAEGYIHGSQDRVIESKEQIKTIINELDCSIVPRPPLCNFGFNPIED